MGRFGDVLSFRVFFLGFRVSSDFSLDVGDGR